MAVVSERRRPIFDDALKAAEHLEAVLDPGEVLLFGSVARDRQGAGSDLDLVLVFDDLGDYAQRRELEVRARRAVAQATGLASDVRVTDRAEWDVRTKRCRSSFEAHIAAHAVTLSSRPPKTDIDWDKEIGMAPSDEQQAAASLNNTSQALNSLQPHLRPYDDESEALSAGDFEYAGELEHTRMLNICAQSQMVMETSLKALIHALKEPHPVNTHDIGGLIDAVGDQLAGPAADGLEAALGPLTSEQASVWREAGTYPADRFIQGDPQQATPEFAAQMAHAATQMATTSIALITQQLGYQTAEAQKALARCRRIDQKLSTLDTPDRSPHPDIGL